MADDRVKDCMVLIVDDNAHNIAMLEDILRKEGFRSVVSTTDPRQTVELIDQLDVDLVVLDLYMPEMSGLEVMAAIRESVLPGTYLPVLVLTAISDDKLKRTALGSGAKDFVAKPFDMAELILRITNLLETRVLHLEVEGHRRGLAEKVRGHDRANVELAAERERRTERINDVLEKGRIRVVFQPVVDLPDVRIIGAEALARFDVEPVRTPDIWFAEAASVGLGTDLELGAIGAALEFLPELPDHCFIAINLSAEAAMAPGLAKMIPPDVLDRVVIELTEHDRVEDYGRLSDALDPLRGAGLRLAVDDAGAGYSGLHHILKLRPDIIKLDLGLTHGIHTDPARRALAAALVGFGREIRSLILAEGVEEEQELQTLAHLGVGGAQGFYLARPGPLPLALLRSPTTSRTPSQRGIHQ